MLVTPSYDGHRDSVHVLFISTTPPLVAFSARRRLEIAVYILIDLWFYLYFPIVRHEQFRLVPALPLGQRRLP